MTPKALICWYYDQRDTQGPKGFNPIDSTGRWYYQTCRAKSKTLPGKVCGHRHRHARKDGEWVCGRCGAKWKYIDRFIFKGEVQTSKRSNGLSRTSERYIDVGSVLHSMMVDPTWRWDMMIFVATCQGHHIKGGLAAEFRKAYPDAPGPWGQRALFYRAADARDEWVRRLGHAGVKTT